ncbi:MAG TPA: serine protease [bacterium]|nr:serine protease [bacterium]
MQADACRPAAARVPTVLLVLCALVAAGPMPGPPAARAGAPAFGPGVFIVVTVDAGTWAPYEYGSAFFFNAEGDAYTASHVVSQAVTHADLRLVAIVDGVEYIARAVCWNPASPDGTNTYNRDVAVIHVGPEVPLFPIGSYPPADRRLAALPLAVRRGSAPVAGRAVWIAGFGGRRAGPVFVPRTQRGRVMRVEPLPDGTVVARIQFPLDAAPADGDSGGPILDAQRAVVGMADWRRTHPLTPGTAELDGVAAASLGCVARVPPERNRLDPSNTPLRMP